MQNLFKVISHSEPVFIQKQDGSSIQKSTIVLQEMGGKYEDSYVAGILGSQFKLFPGDFVWAALRFTAREYNGSNYMDCTVQEIVKLGTTAGDLRSCQ